MDLMARHALLARAKQVHRLEPQVQRYMGGLEHRADRHAELPFAWAAAPQAHAATLNPCDPVEAPTTRANRAVRPQDAFEFGIGSGLVMEEIGGKGGTVRHGLSP